MTNDAASVNPTLRAKVSTGYGRLDDALQGGFLIGSTVVLSAPALVAYSEAMAQTNPGESKKRLEQATEVFRKLGAKRDLEKAQGKFAAVQDLK